MKTKCLLALMLACACVACDKKEEPKNNQLSNSQLTAPQLVGLWYETEKGEYEGFKMKSLAFTESGMLNYRDIADRSLDVELLEAGKHMVMRYSISDNKLNITYMPSGEVESSYETGVLLQNDILTFYRFPAAGSRASNFRLQKAEQIPEVSLSKETKERLDAIFDSSNPLLFDFFSHNGIKALTKEDMQSICPQSVSMPEIDFDKQTVLFTGLKCACTHCGLYRNQKTGLFEFVVERGDSYEDYVYAYRVFAISPNTIERIDKSAVLLYQ